MVNKGILEIIELNQKFYSKHNESFDKSRSFGFWNGFDKTLEFINLNPKILDLGCGNARYLKFLHEKSINIKGYLGIDNSTEFISKNKENYQNYEFQVLDVIKDLNNISEKFDVIVGFGITHHIPSKELRNEWFLSVANLLNKNGVLILSFWNFDKTKSISNLILKDYKKEPGDYFLGWKEDYSEIRYCHFFEKDEIQEIIKNFDDMELLANFEEDQNTYLILKKN